MAAGRWDSAPIRRAVRDAKLKGTLIDLTYGRAGKWVLFLDSGHLVIISASIPVEKMEKENSDLFNYLENGGISP